MKQTKQLVGLAVSLLTVACGDRTYMTESHGRAVRGALAAQTANPNAGSKAKALPGFDAQEANIVAKNYRHSLTAKGQQGDDKGMVVFSQPSATAPTVLAPSVPSNSK